MKRIFAIIVLLGIVMGAVLTGCEKPATTTGTADTNAPAAPAAPASTNK